ncbi:hypothetical protein JCM4814A_00180 [Streptomyces phaeofaciens JCM 4814]|uniref:Uncharacterized protein n=1 Tax=Streptomyces phaeofaciens TaxID=68254 RepID=A0A918HSD4_9ACTN|nr:hypothetical protein [Streptomyces phaeofaciens]GGT96991.1 hypothetical protein GCM10010226_88170 [Streptomyces phaeofaciens]
MFSGTFFVPLKGILVAGTETDPEPETGGAGAAAFLHGPARLFATDTTTGANDAELDDRAHDEAREDAR